RPVLRGQLVLLQPERQECPGRRHRRRRLAESRGQPGHGPELPHQRRRLQLRVQPAPDLRYRLRVSAHYPDDADEQHAQHAVDLPLLSRPCIDHARPSSKERCGNSRLAPWFCAKKRRQPPPERKNETATKSGEYRRKKRRQPPVTVASPRLFLRPSTGPNRPFQPQSLGRVRDPVRIAEGPTAIDAERSATTSASVRIAEGPTAIDAERSAATSASVCGRLTSCSQSVGRGKGHAESMGNAGSSRSTRRKLDQRHDSARSTRFARRAFRST